MRSFELFASVVLMLAAVLIQGRDAMAERRLALVIGNSAYRTSPLANPANDAGLMSEMLARSGFEVQTFTDLGHRDLQRAVVGFGRNLRAAGTDTVGLVFYAGHAVQADGENYLIPVDADIQDVLDLRIQTLDASTLMQSLAEAGNRLNIVVLDACRNNPFKAATRSGARGLAKIDAPFGTLLAYSTAPGDVAADGTGRHSPYALALAKAIQRPGLSVEQVFKTVRLEVIEKTGQRQIPWESSSLTGDFYFNTEDASNQTVSVPAPSTASVPADSVLDEAQAYWNAVRDSQDPAEIQLVIDRFPGSIYAELAELKLQTLQANTRLAAIPAEPPRSAGTDSDFTNSDWLLHWTSLVAKPAPWCRSGENGTLPISVRNGAFEGRIDSNLGANAGVFMTVDAAGSATIRLSDIGRDGSVVAKRPFRLTPEGAEFEFLDRCKGNFKLTRR